MSSRFHPSAEAELSDPIEYYEELEAGLGRDFAIEVHSAVQRALAHPRAWTVLEGDIRRTLVRRFPYGVVYCEYGDGILVVAVMHLRRSPSYWKGRM